MTDETHFTTTQKGPYTFLKADYGSQFPDPDDVIVIKGPCELNALIQLLKSVLKHQYPNWEGFLPLTKNLHDPGD